MGISSLLRYYRTEEKVCIKINPSIHKGMPHRRYHGKIAQVLERRGRSYLVEIPIKNQKKVLAVRPEHLLPVKRDK